MPYIYPTTTIPYQQIEYDKQIKDAEAKAAAIRAITEAEYIKKVKECEAASYMPAQEFELKKMQLQVEMLREIGRAAWQYPDVYTGFLKEFGDKLRIGPMSVSESLGNIAMKTTTDTTTGSNSSNGGIIMAGGSMNTDKE